MGLYDEWDNLDELETAIFGDAPLERPLWEMFSAHRDEIGQALPPPN